MVQRQFVGAKVASRLSRDRSSTDRRRLKSFDLATQIGSTNTRDAIVHSLKPRRVESMQNCAKCQMVNVHVDDRIGELKGRSEFEKCRATEETPVNRSPIDIRQRVEQHGSYGRSEPREPENETQRRQAP
ncbi:hypothetical protein K0M31_010213, partial [Melipona bicolor]